MRMWIYVDTYIDWELLWSVCDAGMMRRVDNWATLPSNDVEWLTNTHVIFSNLSLTQYDMYVPNTNVTAKNGSFSISKTAKSKSPTHQELFCFFSCHSFFHISFVFRSSNMICARICEQHAVPCAFKLNFRFSLHSCIVVVPLPACFVSRFCFFFFSSFVCHMNLYSNCNWKRLKVDFIWIFLCDVNQPFLTAIYA